MQADAQNEINVIFPYQVACLGAPLSEIDCNVERVVQTVHRN